MQYWGMTLIQSLTDKSLFSGQVSTKQITLFAGQRYPPLEQPESGCFVFLLGCFSAFVTDNSYLFICRDDISDSGKQFSTCFGQCGYGMYGVITVRNQNAWSKNADLYAFKRLKAKRSFYAFKSTNIVFSILFKAAFRLGARARRPRTILDGH